MNKLDYNFNPFLDENYDSDINDYSDENIIISPQIIKNFENNKSINYDIIYNNLFGKNKINKNNYIESIAHILEELIFSNKGKVNIISFFNSTKIPKITIKQYLERINKFSKASFESFIICLIYIDRLCEKRDDFNISEVNCHKLIITSFSLASKFHDDLRLNNKDVGKIGGVKPLDLNMMEIEFLNLIEYNVTIGKDVFFSYLLEILEQHK